MEQTKLRNETTRLATEEVEVDLLEVFYRLVENWKSIILIAILGAVLAGLYSVILAKPVYEATSKIYVLSSSDSAINMADLQIGAALTSDYTEVFDAWEVQEMVLQNLNLDYTYSELASKIRINNPSNTRMLYITASAGTAQEAADLANEFASVAIRYIAETMDTEEPNLFSRALVPVDPVSPRKVRNVILGFLLGGVLMAGIVVVRFFLDDKIKSADDIRKYADMVTLAVVPVNGDKAASSRSRGKSSSSKGGSGR